MDLNRGTKVGGFLGNLFTFIFGLLFTAIGLAGTGFLVYVFWQTVQVESWDQVDAVILESKINNPEGSASKYKAYIKYSYTIDEKSYESEGLHPQYHGDSNYSGSEVIIKKFPVGTKLKCYVDPNDKDNAFLYPKIRWIILLFILIPLVFLLIGLGVIIAVFKPDKPEKQEVKKSGGSKLGLVLFFGLFILVGLICFYVMTLGPFIDSMKCKDWIETPCEIVSSKVKYPPRGSNSVNSKTRFFVDILYKYNYEEQEHHSNLFSYLDGVSFDVEYVNAIADRYPVGSQSICFVNPDDPDTAVISKKTDTDSLLLGLIPLAFTVFGLGGIFFLFRKKGKRLKIDAYSYANEDID